MKLSSYTVDPTAAYGDKPSWKSTLYATAGLVVDVLKESSDACTPLKSVAGGLSVILKYCDVCYAYFTEPFTPLTFKSANDGEPRIDRITYTPDRRTCGITQRVRSRGRDQGDSEKEKAQRVIYLISKSKFDPDGMVSSRLEKALRDLEQLAERSKITGFLNNVKDADTLTGLADDIRDAMMDYQVRIREPSARTMPKFVPRLRCSKTSITRTTDSW